jgi:hypothetical protein
MLTVYLVNDAVLTGLDGESSVVEEPFWRSFDAHELQQEIRQEGAVRGQLMLKPTFPTIGGNANGHSVPYRIVYHNTF